MVAASVLSGATNAERPRKNDRATANFYGFFFGSVDLGAGRAGLSARYVQAE